MISVKRQMAAASAEFFKFVFKQFFFLKLQPINLKRNLSLLTGNLNLQSDLSLLLA